MPAKAPPHRPQAALNARAGLLALLIIGASCGARTAASAPAQDSGPEAVLAPGASRRVPDTDLTVVLEAVVEDSRCPRGVSCITAGDAAVRIRVEAPKTAPSTYTLHTNIERAREVEHRGVRIRLVDVMPYPAGDSKIRPDEYRVTLRIEKK